MFGTIARATLKSGSYDAAEAKLAEWTATIRPEVPGEFTLLTGNVAGDKNEYVFIALAQDEQTFREMASKQKQDDWYQGFAALVDGEVEWTDAQVHTS